VGWTLAPTRNPWFDKKVRDSQAAQKDIAGRTNPLLISNRREELVEHDWMDVWVRTSIASSRNALGKQIPPTLDPEATIPIASARRRMNQWGITPMAGKNMIPRPMPPATPWARKTCQYVLQRLVMNILVGYINLC
jgi:hypothetical protein